MKNIILISLDCATCEKSINIIVRSRYQNTPCPIWGEPDKEALKLFAKKLDTIPKSAKKNGKIIRGWSKFFNS